MNKEGDIPAGEKIFGVRVVFREIWAFFVLRGEAVFHRDVIFLV